jgi:hypothetical protein
MHDAALAAQPTRRTAMADYTDRNKNTVQIDDVLVLSTIHLTRKTSERIERSRPGMPAAAIWKDYGYFMWADQGFSIMEISRECLELVRVIDFALNHGCQWIRFDCDGPEIAELPTFGESWSIKLCCKCEGPITTPLLMCQDELCVNCADYDEHDPDHAERQEV